MRRRFLVVACALGCAALPAAHAAGPARTVVYFSSWSALIDPAAQGTIAEVAASAKAQPAQRVTLTGYASTIGSTAANTLLAELRAQVVLDELVTDGVAAQQIAVRAVGATSFVLDPHESRRVEITLGGD